ncbi:MAG TPA: hypothetical protein VHA33_29455 [Candidatus Angelobacter sp.]|nr:hypothetical protein [Candidatus Angelobacter sp.]
MMNRRDVIKSLSAVPVAMALAPVSGLCSATEISSSPSSAQELRIHFRGLWAFIVQENGIIAVTAEIGEHSYHADRQPMAPGEYTLLGVKKEEKKRPNLHGELVICYSGNNGGYINVHMPFPRKITHECTAKAKFDGHFCPHPPPSTFPLEHSFHYYIDGTPSLKPLENWPAPGAGPVIRAQIAAEPGQKLGNSQHPYDAFTKLMALFPNSDVKLHERSLSSNCRKQNNAANPENCIQMWMQPPG